MVPEGLFITGTDTGVGKTVVAAAIALFLRDAGQKVTAFKPVQTGVDPRSKEPSDADVLLQASTPSLCARARALYTLKSPLAPAVAAEIETVKIDVRRIIERCRQLKTQSDVLIVEGVGGVMVPIRWDYSVLDLIKELKLPAVIVARAGLGTINHTTLTFDALKGKGVDIFGIVLNDYPASPDIAEETNPEAVKRMTGFARVFVMPHCEGETAWTVIQALRPFVRALF